MRKLASFFLTSMLIIAACTAVLADKKASAARAEEVIKQARAAIGGEDKIHGVQGFSAKGKFRRVMGEREMSGERVYDFLLPDKFLKEDTLFTPMGTSISNTRVLNGTEAWSSSGGSGGGGMVFVMGPGGATTKPTKEQTEQANKMMAEAMRADFARYVLALLLSPPEGFDVEYSYAGEAVSDDGRADAIDISGPSGFAARLFLDKETHLPLMLTYRGPKPRIMMTSMKTAPGKSREEILKEAQDKANKEAEAPAKREEAEFQIHFADYRKDSGLLLPHRITQSTDGEVSEEWEIKSYDINPQFKADKFEKKS